MSFSDLISLENQLNDSLHSVKDQKVLIHSKIEIHNWNDFLIHAPDFKNFVFESDEIAAQPGRKIQGTGKNRAPQRSKSIVSHIWS